MSHLPPIIIGSTSDNPFAIDVAHFCGQDVDISDIIAMKDFQNTEYCPRFINDEGEISSVGNYLHGRTVVIVSTQVVGDTRNSLAMRNLITARAAKDNGAQRVVLLEPDLFYSCQDRGPREQHSFFDEPRGPKERKKFDGQPFTALLNAQLLKTSGVDSVITIHNHSVSTQRLFSMEFPHQFHNLVPADLFADYLLRSDIVDPGLTVLCAPDRGAAPFVNLMAANMQRVKPVVLRMDKVRSGERSVSLEPSPESDIPVEAIAGKDVIVFDDMVRTGTTIVECCRLLRAYRPRRVIFCVTHFHSSPEGREKLADSSIDEIVTTNTIPTILNRDCQGRLRKKMVVLKLERWVAKKIMGILSHPMASLEHGAPYHVDISSKNPRWQSANKTAH